MTWYDRNWKNRWQERIPNQKKCVQNWREHILRSKKYNSDENSGVQKVWNWFNCRILQNSEWISQPRKAVAVWYSSPFPPQCWTRLEPWKSLTPHTEWSLTTWCFFSKEWGILQENKYNIFFHLMLEAWIHNEEVQDEAMPQWRLAEICLFSFQLHLSSWVMEVDHQTPPQNHCHMVKKFSWESALIVYAAKLLP